VRELQMEVVRLRLQLLSGRLGALEVEMLARRGA
jgi:hypothetical protein